MKAEEKKKGFYNGFDTFAELLAYLKRTPAFIIDLTSNATRFLN